MKRLITTLWHTDPKLTGLGLGMFALLAATGVALIVDPREIGGAPAWMKPAKFAASIGIFTLTLAWVFTFTPEWTKTRHVVSWITTVAMILEIVIIDMQAWRGTTSHFNVRTPLDGTLFTIMGLAIVVQTLSMIAVAAALWRQRFEDPAMGWALRLGTTMTIIGALTGGLMTRPTAAQLDAARRGERMVVAGAHTVGAPDGGPGMPGTGWSLEHGDIRVAHFVGLHAMQPLPLLAYGFTRRGWHGVRRVRTVLSVAASYFALYSLLLWQAFRGQSIMQPDITTATVVLLWAGGTAAAFWLATARTDGLRNRVAVY
jgi:hypothetical protein